MAQEELKEMETKEKKSGMEIESSPENIRTNTAILIAIANAEPDIETTKVELGHLISSLSLAEEVYKSLLDAVLESKKRAIRALNDAKINSNLLDIAEAK